MVLSFTDLCLHKLIFNSVFFANYIYVLPKNCFPLICDFLWRHKCDQFCNHELICFSLRGFIMHWPAKFFQVNVKFTSQVLHLLSAIKNNEIGETTVFDLSTLDYDYNFMNL